MNIQKEKYPNRNWIKGITTKTPAMIGALTLGAGILSAGSADAETIIVDYSANPIIIDASAGYDSEFIDVDGSGSNDIYFYAHKDHWSRVQNVNKSGLISSYYDTDEQQSFARMFGDGTEVGADDFSDSRYFGYFWWDNDLGDWGSEDAHGYFGFQFYAAGDDDGIEDDIHYGWMEVERGSTIITRIGYNNVAGDAALIPGGGNTIPEPGTLTLLATGALGMAGITRRRQRSES